MLKDKQSPQKFSCEYDAKGSKKIELYDAVSKMESDIKEKILR